MDDLETNPTAGEPGAEVATDEAPQIEVEAEPTEGDPEGQTPEGDDAEDVDFEGQTFRVPKVIKEGLMRHKDYTHKTQELGAERTALATERQRIEADRQRFRQDTEAHGANLRELAQLVGMGEQIEAYRKVDLNAIEQQDLANGTRHADRIRWERLDLEQQAQALAQSLHAKEQERQSTSQRERARQVEEAKATFARDIPNWNAVKQPMWETAIAAGFTPDDLENTTDVRMMKLLRLAYIGKQYEDKQRGAIRAATPQRPAAAPVQQVAARRTPSTVPSDKDSDAEWVRKERARMKAVEDARKRA